MSLYILGAAISAILGLAEILFVFSDLASIKFKNYSKAGLYFDPNAEKFYSYKVPRKGWAFFIANSILIAPLFSWISIAVFVGSFIKKRAKKAALPEAIASIDYKLSTCDLERDAAIELINELNEFYYGLKDSDLLSKTSNKTDEKVIEYGVAPKA
jgi:hypothetical protein